MMAIRILSFDFDGCLFNIKYFSERDLIKNNQALFDEIRQENQNFSKAYTFVGSNRQSNAIDYMNGMARHGISCFPVMKDVSDYLGTTLDTFLLADVFGDLPEGTSYARVIDKSYQGKHSDFVFDETKVTILYAQMHKIANENPNEPIVFDFYDDRDDILIGLQYFFAQHPDLMPSNIEMRLHQYDGSSVKLFAEIKGVGFIDKNYRQTVKDFSKQALHYRHDGLVRVADFAQPELLSNRKPLSIQSERGEDPDSPESPSLLPLVYDAKKIFHVGLHKISVKAYQLNERANELLRQGLPYENYRKAAQAAQALHDTLRNAFVLYSQNHNIAAFEETADEAIQTAMQSELKQHRGHLKQILGYAGLAILALLTVATGGLAYAVAGGIQYAFNRHFFFSKTIQTDSMNQVLDLKEATDTFTTSPSA